jgi:membrane-associated phospholipid phosphatase
MENVLDWGIRLIIDVQQNFSPALDKPFTIITFMGEEMFFLILLPLVYWCVNKRLGSRLAILFLFSAWVNALVKVFAAQPRPFEYDSRIKVIFPAGGYGLPSGHSQGAVVLWLYLASQVKKTWFWILALLLIVLISMSRIYLGVHFPTDVLGGCLIGFVLLITYVYFEPKIEPLIKNETTLVQLGIATSFTFILIIISPRLDTECITAAASLMGMATGFILEHKYVGFEAEGLAWKKAVRFILGIVVIFGLWLGLKMAFKGLEPEAVFRFVRYLLVGLWGGVGAPWMFVRLGLAEKSQDG